jgi:molybdate transport system substrate-binding protein
MSEVTVLATTAMKTSFDELAAPFERGSGHRLALTFGPSLQLEKRLGDDAAADVAIVSAAGVDDLLARGKLVSGSVTPIAGSALGVAVPRGAAEPDITSAAAFKHALLAAKSIAVSKPVGGGQSGVHMAKIFAQLGVAEEMAAKAKYGTGGVSGLVGLIVERGEAEIGVQQIAELLAVPGVQFVGPLPDELQCITPFVAAVPATAQNADAGRQLIAFLTSAEAKRVIKAKGLQPA